jgi:RNA polymerase sigma-70 factor (ECF subfamily)
MLGIFPRTSLRARVNLGSIFLAHLPAASVSSDAAGARADSQIEPLLAQLLADGQAAWPDLTLAPEAFIQHLAERMSRDEDPVVVLPKIAGADLYLACACSRGDPAALAAFERDFIARLSARLERADALPSFSDDVKQAVRVRLLVAEEGVVPRIASYRGRGSLWVWLRLTAARLAVNLRNSQGAVDRQRVQDQDLDRLQGKNADPELAFFKAHYGAELRNAIQGALEALPAQDGNILRLHFFEGVSARTMGAMHGVSERTVQRWIRDIRERIIGETRRLLNQRFALTHAQFDSVVGLIDSQLEISIRRLLDRRSTLSASPQGGPIPAE